ncbi:DUF87 domain-containing protein [Pyrobaculum sp. 3827-6]|uniref:ATP-binding protein n=1 Tax=Pyrobaculum sp. 3827-6 TaxID=2983604 RepID=UPI0021D9E194|nr:DUF87 domain-containing protein [Pyrobaculum sp. 3827-6]MCU7786329.1 DUF87 domain-containing protein [Pyrobaculum sp. 3827-6]
MNYYDKTLALFGLSLLAIAIMAKAYPPLALLAVLPVVAWGEEVLVWIHTRVAPLEPLRVAHREPGVEAAFDPRRGLYHVFWRAEPIHSVYGISAAPRLHEMYAKLSLRRGEWVAYFVWGDRKYIRYTARRLAPERLRQVELILKEYYVLNKAEPWLSSRKQPGRWPYLTALLFIPLALISSGWFLLAIPLWLFVYRRVRRWYRVPYLLLSLSHVSRASFLPASREMLEAMASAEAAAFGMMEKWAVAFTDMPPEVVHKKFVKVYEGRDTGKRLIRIRELSEFVERMARYNERPILLYPYGSKDLHSIYMTQDWIATYDFWALRNGVKALSHDLSRFPMFYGGKLLAVGREVVLAYDRFGRPVSVDLDALPTVHGVVIGASGLGKSWTVGSWLGVLAEAGVDVVVVDPHGDYLKWAVLHGAQVVEVPEELPSDMPEVLSRSMWFRRLAGEYGLDAGENAEAVKAVLERMASMAGYSPRFVDVGGRHVVFSVYKARKDAALQAFFYGVLLVYLLAKHVDERVERVRTVIVFDEARLISKRGVPGYSTLSSMLEEIVMGGRKYGLAIWFVLQLETQLEHDLLRSASVQLLFGGGEDVVKPLAHVLYLDEADTAYLLTTVTPREASLSGQPYAMAIMRIKPRNLKYHVKIPLDPRLK